MIQKGQRKVKDIMHGGEPAAAMQRDNSRRPKKRAITQCSICMRRTFNAIPLMEPEGVPEPRREWKLCKDCHEALLVQMRLSPVRSPLRLRIAMGLVAAEGSPHAYIAPRRQFTDRPWIILPPWGFSIHIILPLLSIVLPAHVAGP